MKIFERVCIICRKRYGCKFFNRYDEIVTWSCDTCLFSRCGGDCLCREKNEIEETTGICDKCYKELRNEKKNI